MRDFFTAEKIQNVDVIRFNFSEINLEQREGLKRGLQEQLNNGEKIFLINLSKVGFISSLVIATIVFFAKEVAAADGQVKLCGLSSDAFSIFQLTQLDKIFELYESENDALESFKE